MSSEDESVGRQFGRNRLAMAQRLAAAQKYQQQLQGSESSSSFGWVTDLLGSDSQSHGSYGGGGGGSTTGSCFSLDICPDLVIVAITVAGAAAAYLLYTAITAGRRRKRSAGGDGDLGVGAGSFYPFVSFAEEFLAEGTEFNSIKYFFKLSLVLL